MEKQDLDKECLDIIDNNINMMVPWYLMAAYAYYEQDDPILSDAMFDRLGKRLLENWDKIEHMHKDLITEDMLKAGTYIGEFPSRIEGAVDHLKEACYGKDFRKSNRRSA